MAKRDIPAMSGEWPTCFRQQHTAVPVMSNNPICSNTCWRRNKAHTAAVRFTTQRGAHSSMSCSQGLRLFIS